MIIAPDTIFWNDIDIMFVGSIGSNIATHYIKLG